MRPAQLLLNKLNEVGLEPTKMHVTVEGRLRFLWRVDCSNSDRFLEVQESVQHVDDVFVVLVRDDRELTGSRGGSRVYATLVAGVDHMLRVVEYVVDCLVCGESISTVQMEAC